MTRHRMLRRIAYVRRNRCSALVGALCFFILLNPMLAGSAIGGSMLGVALFVVLAHISIVANGSRDVLSALRTHSIWREQPPTHTRRSSAPQACRQ